MQKLQISSITPCGVELSPPPHSRTNTPFTLTEWQMPFIGPTTGPFWGKKPKPSQAIVAKWYTVLCLPHRWLWVRAPNLHQCLWTHLQVCESKRLGCHADLYTVSRCHTRGESEDHTSGKACKKGSILALKPRADITRSPKQGYRWPHEKDLHPPKIKKNKTIKSSFMNAKGIPHAM